jgi:hypothetical protein
MRMKRRRSASWCYDHEHYLVQICWVVLVAVAGLNLRALVANAVSGNPEYRIEIYRLFPGGIRCGDFGCIVPFVSYPL